MRVLQWNIEESEELFTLLQKEGEYIPSYCGGKGSCGKCKIRFLSGAPEPRYAERRKFSEEELAAGWRLACQTKVFGEASVVLPELSEDAIEAQTEFCAQLLPESNGRIQYEKAENTDGCIVAVDIGTTTLAASAVDLDSGDILGTVTSVNHQRAFGADVISRIDAANNGKGPRLQESIVKDLENLQEKLGLYSTQPRLIVSANTTMTHLLQGYSCKGLGVAPYSPVDISMHTYDNMLILPGISTFVGADIVSGMIACNMDSSEDVSLLIDIGTNGEMVIGNKHGFLAASTAAGPAFEGGNISCGMAGIPGAISSADIIGGRMCIETIDNQGPAGICGTGVMEITCELLKAGLLDETGLLAEPYFEKGYPVSDRIVFTNKDVREVQLAKSAIRTGIEILIKEYGISYDRVDRVYLAGGFGRHINFKKAIGIGLLPEELEDKLLAVGNSSLAGAVLLAQNKCLAERFVTVAGMAKEVLLAENREFQSLYVDHMFFPEQE